MVSVLIQPLTVPLSKTPGPEAEVGLTGVGAGDCQCHQLLSDKLQYSHSCSACSDGDSFPQPGSENSYKCLTYITEPESCSADLVLIQSFKYLLKLYSMHVNNPDPSMGAIGGQSQETPLIIAGGLQQYLIKNMKKSCTLTEQPRKGYGSETTTINDLPDCIHLHIFSYLSAKQLCQISNVCRHWYCVASDNVLWATRLQEDIRAWPVISHTTNPQMYKECQSDWTNKEIYLRCCPEVNRLMKQTNMNFHQLSNILRTFWPKKTPRIAMFGPGLESGTSRLARRILEDQTGTFKSIAMFPGQFEGLGSGFTMKMNSTTSFHLVTLYTSTRQERESHQRTERLQHSRLLNQLNAGSHPQGAAPAGDDSDSEELYEVRKPIQDLCHTLDAFIFVVDASQDQQAIKSARAELYAMVNERWVTPDTPVVIMSCIADMQCSRRHTSVDIVSLLRLSKLSRPWQVRDCNIDTMTGITDAIEWVVSQSQRTS